MRWTTGTRERLQSAALELYGSDGYASTTVAAVAARAGVTERTYFRHFDDKPDVLFADDDELLAILLGAVEAAPGSAGAWAVTTGALQALATALEPRRAELRAREDVIASEPELLERDILKKARWRSRLEQAMQARGIEPAQAAVVAAVAGAAFRMAYTAWLSEAGPPLDLGTSLERTMAELRRFAAIP